MMRGGAKKWYRHGSSGPLACGRNNHGSSSGSWEVLDRKVRCKAKRKSIVLAESCLYV